MKFLQVIPILLLLLGTGVFAFPQDNLFIQKDTKAGDECIQIRRGDILDINGEITGEIGTEKEDEKVLVFKTLENRIFHILITDENEAELVNRSLSGRKAGIRGRVIREESEDSPPLLVPVTFCLLPWD